jgi:hypothetical protein
MERNTKSSSMAATNKIPPIMRLPVELHLNIIDHLTPKRSTSWLCVDNRYFYSLIWAPTHEAVLPPTVPPLLRLSFENHRSILAHLASSDNRAISAVLALLDTNRYFRALIPMLAPGQVLRLHYLFPGILHAHRYHLFVRYCKYRICPQYCVDMRAAGK